MSKRWLPWLRQPFKSCGPPSSVTSRRVNCTISTLNFTAVSSEGFQESDNKKRIFTEEVKQRYVSHWDLDFLPRKDVESAIARRKERDAERGDA